MSLISSIPASPPGALLRTGFNATRSQASPLARLMPSSIVTLGSPAESASLYTAQRTALPKEAAQAVDVASLLSLNVSSGSTAGRFSGLGAALLGQLNSEEYSANEGAKINFSAGAGSAQGVDAAGSAGAVFHGAGDERIALAITTASGVQVSLTLDSRPDGLALQMTSSAALSDAERSALAGLAGAFQDAIDGFSQQPPKVKLDGLTQFDPTLLASVDLHAVVKLDAASSATQTLDFRADGAERKVSLNGPAGIATMRVDTSKLAAVGSAGRQAAAVDSYLKQIDQATGRGHGDAGLMAMFKDAFAGMHSHIGQAQTGAGWAQASKVQLGPEDHAAMSGLADFSASVTQTSMAVNPMRPAEQDSFAYQVSQNTSVSGASQADRSISQQQKSALQATYHTPAVPGTALNLTQDAQSQNYNYHQIDDRASSDISLRYQNGLLASASLLQSATQSARQMQYALGKLVSDKVTPGQHTVTRDLMSALGPYQGMDAGRTEEQRSEQRKLFLESLSGQVLLQAYPNAVGGVAPGEVAAG